jgi:hypothetical protein
VRGDRFPLLRRDADSGGIDERMGIEDESDFPVTENRGSREGLALLETLVEAFDDDLLLADELIHKNAALLVS